MDPKLVSLHTHTHTHTHSYTHTHRHRHTDADTHRQTHKHMHTHTHKHRQIKFPKQKWENSRIKESFLFHEKNLVFWRKWLIAVFFQETLIRGEDLKTTSWTEAKKLLNCFWSITHRCCCCWCCCCCCFCWKGNGIRVAEKRLR